MEHRVYSYAYCNVALCFLYWLCIQFGVGQSFISMSQHENTIPHLKLPPQSLQLTGRPQIVSTSCGGDVKINCIKLIKYFYHLNFMQQWRSYVHEDNLLNFYATWCRLEFVGNPKEAKSLPLSKKKKNICRHSKFR